MTFILVSLETGKLRAEDQFPNLTSLLVTTGVIM